MSPAPRRAPLERSDARRARGLKLRIRDRVGDVRRHLLALRTAMSEFGADFDLDAFRVAFDSEDPVVLNRVKAVERGVEQLSGFIAELAALGLELAGVRGRHEEADARADLDALARAEVLPKELTQRLQRLRELRRMLLRDATAERVHEAALLVTGNLPAFHDRYRDWIQRGFNTNPE